MPSRINIAINVKRARKLKTATKKRGHSRKCPRATAREKFPSTCLLNVHHLNRPPPTGAWISLQETGNTGTWPNPLYDAYTPNHRNPHNDRIRNDYHGQKRLYQAVPQSSMSPKAAWGGNPVKMFFATLLRNISQLKCS